MVLYMLREKKNFKSYHQDMKRKQTSKLMERNDRKIYNEDMILCLIFKHRHRIDMKASSQHTYTKRASTYNIYHT